MGVETILLILLTLLVYPFVFHGVLGYRHIPKIHHSDEDILGFRLKKLLEKLDKRFYSRWTLPTLFTFLSLFAFPLWDWSALDKTHYLRTYILFLSMILTWRAITQDQDLVAKKSDILERVLLLLLTIGLYFYPGFLFLYLFTAVNTLRSWTHHQKALIEILFIFLSFLLSVLGFTLLQNAPLPSQLVPFLFLSLTYIASIYFIPGLTKCLFKPYPFSWIRLNQLHFLVAGAYMWGWLRFLPKKRVVKALEKLKLLNQGLNFFVFFFECAMLFLLFKFSFCFSLLIAASFFHIVYFIFSGALFWQSIFLQVITLYLLYNLPQEAIEQLFSLKSGFFAMILILLLPSRGKIWKPNKLAWWDSPFAARIHWTVIGKSGNIYGLYNDFMDPNDRIFGLTYGFFLSKEKRVTSHLGHAPTFSRVKHLIETKGDFEKIQKVKNEEGTSFYDSLLVSAHDLYMKDFFINFNSGKRKWVCPKWCKAPREEYYIWGRYPRFTGQEPVTEIHVTYREEFFDGKEFMVVRDDPVRSISIPSLPERSKPLPR